LNYLAFSLDWYCIIQTNTMQDIFPVLPFEILQQISEFADTETQITLKNTVRTQVTILQGDKGNKWIVYRLVTGNYSDFRYVQYISLGKIFWEYASKYHRIDFGMFMNLKVLDTSGSGGLISKIIIQNCTKLKIINVLGCKGLWFLDPPDGLKYFISGNLLVLDDNNGYKIVSSKKCRHGHGYDECLQKCNDIFDPRIDSWVGHIAWDLVREIIPEIYHNSDNLNVVNQKTETQFECGTCSPPYNCKNCIICDLQAVVSMS